MLGRSYCLGRTLSSGLKCVEHRKRAAYPYGVAALFLFYMGRWVYGYKE
nr:MAG TPA: hypothetical protein [Caudoviricetes sp.]